MTVSLLPEEGQPRGLAKDQKLSQREFRQIQTHSNMRTENPT
jgi:hypothetical protein